MRRCLSAALVLFVLAGFVLADQVKGIITSVSKDEVKVRVKGEKEAKVYKVTGATKFCKATGKDKKDGSDLEEVTKIVDKAASGGGKAKGAFGVIEVDGDTAKEICVIAGGRPGKDKGKKKNP